INIPAGMLVADNHSLMWPVLIAAYVGVICGDVLWFIVVSRWGARLLHVRRFKRILHPRRLLQAKYRIDRHGAWIIVLARFIPASRTTTITVAGMLHLPFWKFFLATVSCVLITAPVQVGVGWLIGRELTTRGTFDLIQWSVGLFLLAAVLVAVIWLWRRQRRHGGHPPRARVAWLKQFRRSSSNSKR
ncbi:MAG: DedA family protein, partial [Phycisphaerales bacterium]|nr:DedA family protein [Phycisphaerales bacterium]